MVFRFRDPAKGFVTSLPAFEDHKVIESDMD